MFLVNGVISIIGAFYTSLDLEWVLTTAGLISEGLWNLLYFALAVIFLFVLLRRRSITA
jgi:nitrate/nitrite transporter NarK